MKKILTITVLAFIGTLYSCNKFLDVVPDNIATLDNAFADRYTAERYLFTCYSYLPDFASTSGNPALNCGDDIWYAEWHEWKPGVKIAKGEQNITSPYFDFWRGSNYGKPLYIGIRDCNIFLENVDRVKGLNVAEKKRWIAEVTFLKAYYHYYLIRMYGPIHIIDKSIPVSAQTDQIKVYRDPVDSCFNYVVRLLDQAIIDLPPIMQNAATELGRISKPIAMSIKAEVLITAASPLFNGNPNYSGLADNKGQHLFSATFDPEKWEKAAVACKEAIDQCHEVGTQLFEKSDYINAFDVSDTTRQIAALRSAVSQRWSKELIWGCTNALTGDLQYNCAPRFYTSVDNPVGSNHAPTLVVAEEFYSNNGVPINEDIAWGYDNRYKLRTATVDNALLLMPNEQTVRLNFDREYRYYASLSFDRGAWFGNGKETDDHDPWYIKNRKGEFASIFEISQYSITGLYPKKLVNLGSVITNGSWLNSEEYAFPVMRLADLYLYYAEALNETKSAPDAEVYEYIDIVRNRAGLQGVVDSWSQFSTSPGKPNSKAGMREIIQRERLIEMAFEGQRFWDLRRWLLAKSYMNKAVKGWDVFQTNISGYYRVKTLFNQSFTERDYLWPIPEGELVKNPNLVQNLGW
jgi:hypothetical protein